MSAAAEIKKPTDIARRSPWRRVRLACLVWLVVCQFPLPVVHSHESLVSLDPLALRSHLQCHHADQVDCAQCDEHELHWHWLLPSELTWHSNGGENARLPMGNGLMGVWSGGLQSALQSSHVHDLGSDTTGAHNEASVGTVPRDVIADELLHLTSPSLPAQYLNIELRLGLRDSKCIADDGSIRARSFAQSYLGISLADLVSVRLR